VVLFYNKQIKKGEIIVAFRPTTNILADFFIKPLKGSLLMRSTILSLPNNNKIDDVPINVLEKTEKSSHEIAAI